MFEITDGLGQVIGQCGALTPAPNVAFVLVAQLNNDIVIFNHIK